MREFGAQHASSPDTSTVAEPPLAGMTQMSNPDPFCDVNNIHWPSGDQSGSDGLETPDVGIRDALPPPGDIFHNDRRSLGFAA